MERGGMAGRAFQLPLSYRAESAGVIVDMRPPAVALTFVSALAVLLLSGLMLGLIGIPYDEAGGNALLKIHPATYLSVLTIGCWIAADGGLAPFLRRCWQDSPGVLAFLLAILLLGFQAVIVQKSPVSQIADNFILTACLFVSLTRLDSRELRLLAAVVQVLLLINSLLGYVEGLTGFRLTPLYVNGVLLGYEWRSTALLGNPLMNALMTAIAVTLLALGATPFGRATRVAMMVVHFGALVFFGGRTALVLAALALAGIGALEAARIGLGRRFPLRHAASIVLLVTALLIGAVIAIEGGMLDRLLGRFVNDDGSAATRLAMLSVFRDMSWPEVLFGPDLGFVKAMQMKLNIAIAIESAYVGFVAFFGGVVTLFFLAGLAAFLAEFPRRFGAAVLIPLGIYLLISTTVSSFSTKSTELAVLTAVIFPAFACRPRFSRTPSSRC